MSTHTQSTNPDQPNYIRPELKAALPDLRLLSDLLAGTRTMQAKAEDRGYIRKWKHEDPEVYRIRRTSEEVYDGLGRTLNASVGMLYAKPPKMEWNAGEKQMQAHWQNLDMAGTAGHVMLKRISERSIRDGLGIILVDHTRQADLPEGALLHDGNAEDLGVRPRWAYYDRIAGLSWSTSAVSNRETLTGIVLHEPTKRAVGRYGVEVVNRYRELRLGEEGATWTLWEESKGESVGAGASEFKPIREGAFRNRAGEPARFLPISLVYTGRTDQTMTAHPPLMGVGWTNLGHWRTATNLEFYRQLCAFPQPTVVGKLQPEPNADGQLSPGKLRLGPLVVVQVEEGGDFHWTELTGSSIEALERGLTSKERWMGQQGMSFLAPDTRQAETAEAKRLDSTAQNATLATVAQGIDDGVNMALQHHGWYLGIEPEQVPTFEINRDFENTAMDARTMAVYVQAVWRAGLPVRLLLEAWQQGGRIPADADLDEIELQMMAMGTAEADAEGGDELDLDLAS